MLNPQSTSYTVQDYIIKDAACGVSGIKIQASTLVVKLFWQKKVTPISARARCLRLYFGTLFYLLVYDRYGRKEVGSYGLLPGGPNAAAG